MYDFHLSVDCAIIARKMVLLSQIFPPKFGSYHAYACLYMCLQQDTFFVRCVCVCV